MGKRVYYQKERRVDKLSNDETLGMTFDLISTFGQIKSDDDAAVLLKDMLTGDEIKDLAKRLRIVKMLLDKKSQREISGALHCSLATVTKISIWLQQSDGKLEKIISKLPKMYNLPKNLPAIPIEFQAPQVLLSITQQMIAQNQRNKMNKFFRKVEEKSLIDKTFKESTDIEFKTRRR